MSLPATASTVTVTETYVDAAGEEVDGTVTFTPSVRVVVEGTSITVDRVTARVVRGQLLNPDGDGPLLLAATDDPDLSPSGWTYLVVEKVGSLRRSYNVSLPASPSTRVLHTLAPVDPVDPSATRVLTVEGIAPDAQGNVDLPPAAGGVPTSRQVIAGTGLTGGGDLSADRTFVVAYGTSATTAARGDDSRLSDPRTPLAHTHPISEVVNLQAGLDGKETAGAASAAMTAHLAASDPHPQYLTAAEGNAAYATVAAVAGKATKKTVMPRTVTSGDVPLNTAGSSWAPLTGSPTLTVPAVAGDLIVVELGSVMRTIGSSNKYLDVAVVVAGGLRRMLGNGQTGTPVAVDASYEGMALLYHTNFPAGGGRLPFVATANDIDGSGNVTVSFACRSVGSDSPVLCAGTANPLVWSLSNEGAVTTL
jgi:hypothetical protein